MSVLLNPDCLNGAHRACSGGGWCEDKDQAAPCPCDCHGGPVGAEHYPGCPCGVCQQVRAAQPTTHAIQARHLSGASIGKLIEWELGRSLLTGERQWSPAGTLAHITHGADRAELHIRWNETTTDLIDLTPNEWVRVTNSPNPPSLAKF